MGIHTRTHPTCKVVDSPTRRARYCSYLFLDGSKLSKLPIPPSGQRAHSRRCSRSEVWSTLWSMVSTMKWSFVTREWNLGTQWRSIWNFNMGFASTVRLRAVKVGQRRLCHLHVRLPGAKLRRSRFLLRFPHFSFLGVLNWQPSCRRAILDERPPLLLVFVYGMLVLN